jgi:chromosome segregation ATPase
LLAHTLPDAVGSSLHQASQPVAPVAHGGGLARASARDAHASFVHGAGAYSGVMTSKRPPRRDPRAEDGQAPPADDLGAAKRVRPATRAPTSAGTSESDFEMLRSRYAEAESKRRRADALADGLAQRIAHLEAELRARPSQGGADEARKRLEAQVADLEAELRERRADLDATFHRLEASEAANAELDEKLAHARARADAAEAELERLEEGQAHDEAERSEGAQKLEQRVRTLEGELAASREARTSLEASVTEAEAALTAARAELAAHGDSARAKDSTADELRARCASLEADVAAKARELTALGEREKAAEEKARVAEEARSAEKTAATEARAKLASTAAKASEAAMKLTGLEEELAKARRVQAELDARIQALEGEKSEQAAKLATTGAKLSATESKLATLQSMATELDQALQRERARAAEIEAGQRRVQTAAAASAREVIARLERHEAKLSGIRREALTRAIALLDEAGGVHSANSDGAGRLTPAVPASRPGVSVARATAAETAPGQPRPRTTQALIPAAVSEPAPTPAQPAVRVASPRRTMQGLSALPRGAFGGDAKSPSQPPPKPTDDADIEISVDDES